MEELMNGYATPISSPSSPLPISVGPGNRNYLFSPSPTPSPPTSNHASAESLPFLHDNPTTTPPVQVRSAFSLDKKDPGELEDKTSCLKDLLEWLVQKCCGSCS